MHIIQWIICTYLRTLEAETDLSLIGIKLQRIAGQKQHKHPKDFTITTACSRKHDIQ